jgi:hypothetical protein
MPLSCRSVGLRSKTGDSAEASFMQHCKSIRGNFSFCVESHPTQNEMYNQVPARSRHPATAPESCLTPTMYEKESTIEQFIHKQTFSLGREGGVSFNTQDGVRRNGF